VTYAGHILFPLFFPTTDERRSPSPSPPKQHNKPKLRPRKSNTESHAGGAAAAAAAAAPGCKKERKHKAKDRSSRAPRVREDCHDGPPAVGSVGSIKQEAGDGQGGGDSGGPAGIRGGMGAGLAPGNQGGIPFIDLESDKEDNNQGANEPPGGAGAAAAAAAAGAGGRVKKEEKGGISTYKTVALSQLSTKDIVAIFRQHKGLRDLTNVIEEDEVDGETLARCVGLKASDASMELQHLFKKGKVASIVSWIESIDTNAVRVPIP